MKLSISRLKLEASGRLGLTRARWALRSPGLYVFTFHRIGDACQSTYDPNVFSCSAGEFARIIDFLRQEFDVIGLSEVQQCLDRPASRQRAALITFDDGYIDNYKVAMPQLKERKLSATFFIATSMADGQMPWWDTLAWWTRHAQAATARLNGDLIELGRDRAGAIRPVLRAFKEEPGGIRDKLDRYRNALKPDRDLPVDRLIMSWEQLRSAVSDGFSVGSHTVNHPILSHLSEAEQRVELADSKATLEDRLGTRVTAVAFPVGGETAYTRQTTRIAREVGYEFAFTSVGGLNRWTSFQGDRLNRIAIDSGDLAELRYRVANFA